MHINGDEMFDKRIFLFVVLASLLLYGCLDWITGGSDISETIKEELEAEGIDVTNVELEENNIIVTYNQQVSEEEAEVYATWAYIMGVAIKNAPSGSSAGTQKATIICNFDNEESLKVTATAGNVILFLNDEMSTWEFLYTLEMEGLTQGPQWDN